jgi:hypothetical protein
MIILKPPPRPVECAAYSIKLRPILVAAATRMPFAFCLKPTNLHNLKLPYERSSELFPRAPIEILHRLARQLALPPRFVRIAQQ